MENIVYWEDKELVNLDIKASHVNGGRLEKYWVMDRKSGKQFLIKGSLPFCYEPICEKIAYIIGRDLGIDVLEYDVLPANMFKGMLKLSPLCKYVSICEKLDRSDFSITSVAEIKRAINVTKEDAGKKPIRNNEVMYAYLDRRYIDTMLLYDAIIGNEDRHYGNVHLLKGNSGELLGSPILDNGDSLLSSHLAFPSWLKGFDVWKSADKSSCMEYTHVDEMKFIKTLYGININIPLITIKILNDIEPTLQMFGYFRRESVRKFIVKRLHYFLGYVKDLKNNPKFVEMPDGIREIEYSSIDKKEIEHT